MMASLLLRNIPKSNLIRQPTLSKLQKKNASTSTESNSGSVSMGLPLAVGCLSLGIGVTMLAQNSVLKKYFPNSDPVPEKIVTATEPKIIEEIISQNRKIVQLESYLERLKDDLRERDLKLVEAVSKQVAPAAGTAGNGNVFELSQIIEANNIASASKNERILEEQRQQLVREHLIKVEGEVLKVENKYRPTINKIRELEAHLEKQNQVRAKEAPARLLWISCQALLDSMRYGAQKPLEKNPAYEVLREFANNNNHLAISVLDSIPVKALKEGVQSEETLIDRFSKVERVCRRVALVDERGGGIGKYLMSYLQSLFIIDNVKISEDEVAGRQLVDPTTWHTYDILARVKYCLQRHNLEQAVRYANQLRGQARVVAKDWIRDARVYLETMQAFSLLSTHAEATAVDALRQTFVK